MTIEKVLEIKEVETEAQDIRTSAAEEARMLMEDARKEVQSIELSAKQEADAVYRKAIEKAESEADIIFDRIILSAERDCDTLEANAFRNKDKAVSIIVERIVG